MPKQVRNDNSVSVGLLLTQRCHRWSITSSYAKDQEYLMLLLPSNFIIISINQNKNTIMKVLSVISFLLICTSMHVHAQNKLWTEQDRQYHLQNFNRTRDSLIRETSNLTDAQWHFKEAPDRWSIAEIVEHLALWEIIFARETGIMLRSDPRPELIQASRSDSSYLNFVMEEKVHNSPDYSRPTGFIRGKNNLDFFLNKNAETIRFVSNTESDLKLYFEQVGGGMFRNVHQVYLVQWGHVDRHLRQIKKVKSHPDFPKGK